MISSERLQAEHSCGFSATCKYSFALLAISEEIECDCKEEWLGSLSRVRAPSMFVDGPSEDVPCTN